MIASKTWEQLDEIIYNIYGSNDSAALRTGFLRDIASCFHYSAAFFDLKGTYRGKTFYYDPIAVNLPREQLDLYYSQYADKDFTSWVLNQPENYAVYRDSDLISGDVQRKSALYREWLEPLDLICSCGAIISYGDMIYGTVTFSRRGDEGDFSDGDMEILHILVRHLCLRFHQLYPSGIAYGRQGDERTAFREHYHLTSREDELCHLLCSDVSTQEIARLLCISVHTVNRHIANIYQKVNVNTRLELISAMAPYNGDGK